MKVLDCTLRDGGYYNAWNFPPAVVDRYLVAMDEAKVDVVEIGLRSLINKGFKGANAYTTESYLNQLAVPQALEIAVMVNASELVRGDVGRTLSQLFPVPCSESKASLVRVACHVHEFGDALPAANWLKDRGYSVGFNLMQIADRTEDEVKSLAREASKYPIDVLYFADSMGSMRPAQASEIYEWLRAEWGGEVGIHTHDNMGLALQNSLAALERGVSWIDATVTGMGRGPGNARTEEVMIEIASRFARKVNLVPLLSLIGSYFQPLKNSCGWGSNPYYYLSGKHGIHPTYIQEMLGDARYSVEDLLAVIEYLRAHGGKKYSSDSLEAARFFFRERGQGAWAAAELVGGRELLVLGAGPSVTEHATAVESYIRRRKPVVLAVNTCSPVAQELIDVRAACHPVRLLADCAQHQRLPQPLITPLSSLPPDVQAAFSGKEVLDFGITVSTGRFDFLRTRAVIPSALVISYVLAMAASGGARSVTLAGFDGFGAGDARTDEMNEVFACFRAHSHIEVASITPTIYQVIERSVYSTEGAE